MGVDIEYLLSFLKDELQDLQDSEGSGLRIIAVLPSTTQKSVDLPQDYDPNENQIHLKRGVNVKAGSREFYFPATWVSEGNMHLVHEQAQEVREFCFHRQ